jgi:two-component system phosphate regulon sensor histidine kinase PhoR
MFLNIVKNALTYGKINGHVVLDGKIDNKYIEIRISDDGIGISKYDLPRIFERFYRVDKARAHIETDSHTGLGLSISNWIAQTHGGNISVQSEIGKGSTFTVTLPIIV